MYSGTSDRSSFLTPTAYAPEQDGATTSDTAVQSLLSANGGSLTIAGTDSQHKSTGAGNVNTQGGTLLAQDNAVIACEGAACNEVSNFIQQQMASLGCTAPSACPDYGTLNDYWTATQAKAQGLEGNRWNLFSTLNDEYSAGDRRGQACQGVGG